MFSVSRATFKRGTRSEGGGFNTLIHTYHFCSVLDMFMEAEKKLCSLPHYLRFLSSDKWFASLV